MIEFKTKVLTTTIMDPREGFIVKIDTKSAMITYGRKQQACSFRWVNRRGLPSGHSRKRKRCPFCPSNIERNPRFHQVSQEDICAGRATLIPIANRFSA